MTTPPTTPAASRAPLLLFLLALTVLAAALYTARLRHPGPTSGEYWSDSNVINASRGFDSAGLAPTWGIPRVQTAAPTNDPSGLYVTYPPGPYWFSYASWSLAHTLNLDPLTTARLVAQTVGLASAILFVLLIRRLTASPTLATLAGLFYILSPAFASYSAALHHMAYSPALLFATLLAWLQIERTTTPRARHAWTAATAALYALVCWTNLEHIFFIALFIAARALTRPTRRTFLAAALITPIPLPMMALRVLHNAQVLGGLSNSLQRFRGAARRRSLDTPAGVDLSELLTTWLARLDFPVADRSQRSLNWNQEYIYPAANPWVLSALAACLLTIALFRLIPRPALIPPPPTTPPPPNPARTRTPIAAGLLASLLLLACGLTWFVFMTQHTRPHRFIILLLMPGLATLLATITLATLHAARRATAHLSTPAALYLRAHAWALALALLLAFAINLRRADVLNQLAPLDPDMHAKVTRWIDQDTRLASLGHALRNLAITRLFLYHGSAVRPSHAASINIPFRFSQDTIPDTLAPHDALYADPRDENEIADTLTAIARFNLPTFLDSADNSTLVILPRTNPPAPPITITLPAAILTIHDRDIRPALAGPTHVAAIHLTADPAFPAELLTTSWTLTLLDNAGSPILNRTTRLRREPFRTDTAALILFDLPPQAVARATSATLTLDSQPDSTVDIPIRRATTP